MKTFLKETFVPCVANKSLLLIDAWGGHCKKLVRDCTQPDKEIETATIPKGITGMSQPLHVYGFRVWKNYVRHFSDIVSTPRYINLFKYSWYASRYLRRKDHKNLKIQYSFLLRIHLQQTVNLADARMWT